jgi:regulator of sigma E protease
MLSLLAMKAVSVLLAIVALGILIIVHEGGHFLVARLSGMRVDRFSIGFGPALARFQRGETVYQIAMIPLGGFVQIAGLTPGDPAADKTVVERDGRFVEVERNLDDDPRSYRNRPVYQRLLTIFAGPGTNYVFAALMMAIVYIVFGVPQPGKLPTVAELIPEMPAAAAGIQPGDDVVSVDGKVVKDTNDVSQIVEASKGHPLTVVVNREGEEKTLHVTPRPDGGHLRIGVLLQPREVWVHAPPGKAIVAGLVYPYELSKGMLRGLAAIFAGKQKAELQGPVGIVKALKGQIARGPADGFSMVAAISALLGLFNLLPLPALDGGRLVFLAYEATTRRRFPERAEQMIHMVGMFALLGFLLFVTVSDLRRIFQ